MHTDGVASGSGARIAEQKRTDAKKMSRTDAMDANTMHRKGIADISVDAHIKTGGKEWASDVNTKQVKAKRKT